MQSLRGPLAALICLSLLTPSETASSQTASPQLSSHQSVATQARPASRPAYHSAQFEGDQRILHALNRFTFGPRPGDCEAVKQIGLDRWFDQQLHPAGINQSVLDARLAEYPAMQSSSQDLLYRMPSNAVIRQAMDGKAQIPEGAFLNDVYQNQIYRVTEKKQEKENKQQPASAAGASTISGSTMDSGSAANPDNALGKLQDSPDKDIDKDQPANFMNMAPATAMHATAAIEPPAVTTIATLPSQQRIARLTAMPAGEFDAFFKSLNGQQRVTLMAGLTPQMKESVGALENPERTVVEELIAQRLTRDIYSNAQLQEVMTDFWFNHFNVFLRKNEATPYYLVSYERDVIRPRALGKFEDLLEATAHSPAMLLYLDNAQSIGPNSLAAEREKLNAARNPSKTKKAPEGLNENYARELMELHTLGVNGGYTQADVTQVARILTGWTVDRPQRGGGFQFNPNRHEPGTKKVLGKKFKENGEREGRDLLHLLATRPATAQFLSRKLAIRFVSDDPPKSLVDRMAKSYLSSGGDISVVLKTMFHSPELWSADVYRAKVKTPLEYVISAARASNADITNLQPLANALREMGMPLYGAIPPTGYKWDAPDWVSTGALVNRMNFALSLAANRLPGITTTWASSTFVAGTSSTPQTMTPESEESRLEPLLITGDVSETTRSAVLQQFEAQNSSAQAAQQQPQPKPRAQAQPVSTGARPQNRAPVSAQERQDQLLAGLLLGSPEFQRR
jgi:uncharacterized protein (DUF1800 family)